MYLQNISISGNNNQKHDGIEELEIILDNNNINPYEFATKTREQLFGLTQKKNNIFIFGPPCSGKNMIKWRA